MLGLVEGTPVDIPEYRDFISAGTYLLGVLIVAMVPVITTLINRQAKKAATEVKKALDDHPTSNGFTDEVKSALDEVKKSVGGLHGRLDQMTADTASYQKHMDQWMIGIDGRLIHIEEGNGNGPENDSTTDAARS